MKPFPRIIGGLWPAGFFILLLLAIPLLVFAQDGGGGVAADESSGGAIDVVGDVEGMDSSVAEGEGAVVTSVVEYEIDEATDLKILKPEEVVISAWTPEPEFNYNFKSPSEFKVVDRPNDEGGSFVMLMSSTDTDSDQYEYWGYESPSGEPGTWTNFGSVPTNAGYVWEDPSLFGFFLSELNQGSKEHYFMSASEYPKRGVHQYDIATDPVDLNKVIVTAMVYDAEIKDYSAIGVYAELKPIGGDKIKLEYDEAASAGLEWGAVYSGTGTWTPLKVSVTKPVWLTITAETGGRHTVILECQNKEIRVVSETGDPTLDVFERRITGSGSEGTVPDNRDPHYFMVYAVPVGYFLPNFPPAPEGFMNPAGLVLPDGSDLPPDEWRVGSVVGPEIARENSWNTGRTNNFLWSIVICVAVMVYIFRARKGSSLFLRRIAGLDHVDEAIGRATEMGRPILYTTGLGYISDIATIASVNILGQVAKKIAHYDSKLINPHRDPIIMAVCQEVVEEAYIDAGRPDAFVRENIFFITDDQFAYAAAVNGIMVREKPATILLMGLFYAESLLLAETGASTGAIQIAGTDAQAQLPFFITACDYTLIGEELYAASAYLSREPLLVGSLKGQDFAKMIFMILAFIGTLLIFANIEFVKQLFQAF